MPLLTPFYSKELHYTTQTMALTIRAFLELGSEEEAENIYAIAKNEGLLNAAVINVYLQYWAIRKNADKIEESFARFELDSIEPDELSYMLKLKALFHMNDLQGFFETWNEMQASKSHLITSQTYNLIALSLAHGKDTDRLQVLLSDIVNKFHVKPGATYKDQDIYESILLLHGFSGDYQKIVNTFNHMMAVERIKISNAHCVAAMMGMCAASRATLAEKFVYQFVRKELIRFKKAMNINLRMLYRILLAECIEARDAEVATRTYDSIYSTGVVPGDLLPFETNCMVRLHLDRGEEDLATHYFERFLQSVPLSNKTPIPLDLARIYINHYIQMNEPAKTLRFWQKYGALVDTSSTSAPANAPFSSPIFDKSRLALEVYAIAGDSKAARALFDKFVAEGITPTPEICQLVMKAFINAGDTKRAIHLFEETQTNGVAPTTNTYNLVVRIYASRGDYAKVMSTIESMEANGCEPNGQTWSFVLQCLVQMRKFNDALLTFEKKFILPESTSANPSSASSSSAAAAKASAGDSSSKPLFVPTLAEFEKVMHAAHMLNDAKRIARYWDAMKLLETSMTIDHFLATLTPAGSNKAMFISVLQALKKRIIKSSFGMTFDQSKQLANIIRQVVVSQHSPHWRDLELLSQPQGRGQLTWDNKKDWATLLQKVVFEWTSKNPDS